MEKVKAFKNYLFLNTASGTTPTWSRAGKATSFAIDAGPQTETNQFIEDEFPTTDLLSYEPSLEQEYTALIGNAVYDYLFNIWHTKAAEEAAKTQALIVYQQTSGTSQTPPNIAEKYDVTVTISKLDIQAGKITYKIYLNGTPVNGTATIADGVPTFTEAA